MAVDYIPPTPKVVDKVLESFKNKIKKMYEKRDTLFKQTVQICFEEF